MKDSKTRVGIKRQRFRKIPPGIYQMRNSKNLLIIHPDGDYNVGYICIRREKYRYARWRENGKVKEKYLGTV